MAKDSCSTCHTNRAADGRSYCRPCERILNKAYEKRRQRNMTPERRRRSIARAYARVYLSRGKIQRGTVCIACEQPGGKLEMHHEDYRKPLEVVWMHRECHRQMHRVMRQRISEQILALRAGTKRLLES